LKDPRLAQFTFEMRYGILVKKHKGDNMSTIESNKEVLNGVSVFKGTRVPVRNLFDYLVAGETIKDFLEDFPTVSFEQVRHILQSAEVAIENHQAA